MNAQIETIKNHIDVINTNIDIKTKELGDVIDRLITYEGRELTDIEDAYKKIYLIKKEYIEKRIAKYQEELKAHYEFISK